MVQKISRKNPGRFFKYDHIWPLKGVFFWWELPNCVTTRITISHTIHVYAYIYLYIYHKNQPNVGKYTSPMDCLGIFRICSCGNSEFNEFTSHILGDYIWKCLCPSKLKGTWWWIVGLSQESQCQMGKNLGSTTDQLHQLHPWKLYNMSPKKGLFQ